MTIDLTPDLERALAEAARERGTTPESLALEVLRDRFVQPKPSFPNGKEPANMEEFLEGFIGVLNSSEHVPGGANMSTMTGRDIGDDLFRRREEGRL